MRQIGCIVVDDEPIARRGMKRLIETRPELRLDAMFGSAAEAREYMAVHDVGLMFLDIRMPGVSGLEFAAGVPRDCLVIFTTAYSEYAAESYEVDALDYLVKPVDPARFDRAVDKAVAYSGMLEAARRSETEADRGPDFLIVKADRRYVRINLCDIIYVEGLKDYVIIHLPDRKVVTRMTVKGMEETLPASEFIRVNKSYIVSRDKIDSFDSNDVYIGTAEISIGASYRDMVLSSLLGK